MYVNPFYNTFMLDGKRTKVPDGWNLITYGKIETGDRCFEFSSIVFQDVEESDVGRSLDIGEWSCWIVIRKAKKTEKIA